MKHKQIIEKMTLQQKALLMSGKNNWETVGFEALGIPSIFLADGPHGLRKQLGEADHLGLNESVPATCFPTAATIANSWDETLGEEIGQHLGIEAKYHDVRVLLGPGLNIKRNPLCGRNFEYFSEDPYLSGKLAAAYTRGIQANGTVATPKHLAANSQELRRMSSNSIVDERALREIYLTGFEISVKEGKAKGMMSAYNKINGTYANEDQNLLRNILVDEWGFDGFVVSDWGGSNDHVLGVQNGSHLEMPATGFNGPKELIDAVNEGRLSEAILNERVDELLTVILAELPEEKITPDVEKQHNMAKKAARESIVLMKNEAQILPLKPQTKVAIIGDFAKTPRYQGAGSSLVNPTKLDNTIDLVKAYPIDFVGYGKGYHRTRKADKQLVTEAEALAKQAEVVLLYLGLDEISESEGVDRTHLNLPQDQLALLAAIHQVNQNIVVVLSAGSVIDMSWDGQVKGILHGYLSGQAGAGAMLETIVGQATPSGKLSETYPLKYEDVPSASFYPSVTNNAFYKESIYVGYRYYETAQVPVKYPFGHGLSYTTFDYSNLAVSENGIQCTIKNIGDYDGAEIVQLYVSTDATAVFRPKKELKGFKKIWLKAGETAQITIPFDDKTFRFYHQATKQWVVESADYHLMIGASVQDIRLVGMLPVTGTSSAALTSNVPLPNYETGLIQQVTDEEFSLLLGTDLPTDTWYKGQQLDMNDAICQMAYAKSGLARVVYKMLHYLKRRSEKKGKPDLNILFIYNMPFRGVAKMTNGMFNMAMMEAVLVMVNGRFFAGLSKLLKARKEVKLLKKTMMSDEMAHVNKG